MPLQNTVSSVDKRRRGAPKSRKRSPSPTSTFSFMSSLFPPLLLQKIQRNDPSKRNGSKQNSSTTTTTAAAAAPTTTHVYLPLNARKALASFVYKGQDNSWMYKTIWSPICKKTVDKVPSFVSANAITVVALIQGCIPYLLHIWYTLKATHEDGHAPPAFTSFHTPGYVFALNALALVAYQYLDNLDGHQARNLKMASPLGLWLDHGCDAFHSVVMTFCVSTFMSLGATWKAMSIIVSALVAFYLNTWEEYHVGALILPVINGPNEGLVILMAVYLWTAHVGSGWWRQTTTLLHYDPLSPAANSSLASLAGPPLARFSGAPVNDPFTLTCEYNTIFVVLELIGAVGTCFGNLYTVLIKPEQHRRRAKRMLQRLNVARKRRVEQLRRSLSLPLSDDDEDDNNNSTPSGRRRRSRTPVLTATKQSFTQHSVLLRSTTDSDSDITTSDSDSSSYGETEDECHVAPDTPTMVAGPSLTNAREKEGKDAYDSHSPRPHDNSIIYRSSPAPAPASPTGTEGNPSSSSFLTNLRSSVSHVDATEVKRREEVRVVVIEEVETIHLGDALMTLIPVIFLTAVSCFVQYGTSAFDSYPHLTAITIGLLYTYITVSLMLTHMCAIKLHDCQSTSFWYVMVSTVALLAHWSSPTHDAAAVSSDGITEERKANVVFLAIAAGITVVLLLHLAITSAYEMASALQITIFYVPHKKRDEMKGRKKRKTIVERFTSQRSERGDGSTSREGSRSRKQSSHRSTNKGKSSDTSLENTPAK